ncbi:MAG: T9SS type A sorting domain-containing protein [Bacteroidota bacterium]
MKTFLLLLCVLTFGRVTAQTSVPIPPYYNLNAGGADNAFPLNSATNMVQWVFAPGAFNTSGTTGTPATAGYITKIYFLIGATNSNTAVYSNFTLKMAQNVGTITAWPAIAFNPGMTTVFAAPSFVITGSAAGAWIMVPLATPFPYDPTLSLVFEMSVTAGTGNQTRQTTITGNSRVFGATGGAATGAATGQLNFGIDVINLAGNDGGVLNFSSPTTAAVGANTMIARVKNFGKNVINNVNVNWSVNGVLQTPVSYTSPIDTLNGSGSNIVPITLGTLTASPNVTYRVRAWTSQPNGVTDTIPGNDSTFAIYRAPALSGTYTIGATGDFPTITEAATVLNSAGVSGPVTFNLIDNLYTTSTGEVFPITFNNITGTSSTNTITFKPALGTQPLISDSVATNLIVFNGSRWVGFDGRAFAGDSTRNITFENRSTASTSNVITYLNESSDDVLRNCFIRSANVAVAAFGSVFIAGSNAGVPSGNDRILIRSNTFAGSRGNYYATAFGSTGQSSFGQNDAIRIDSNYFYNFRLNGIAANATAAGIGSNWLIQGNHFYDTTVTGGTNTLTCINFNPSTSSNSNGDTIRGNFIGGNAPYAPQGAGQRWLYNGTGIFQGILSSGGSGSGCAILQNYFRSFKANSPTATGQITAIIAANPGVARVADNVIGDMTDTSSVWVNLTAAFVGINSTTTNDLIITDNLVSNVNMVGNNASAAVRGITVSTGSNNQISITDNWIRAMHTRSTNTGTTTACALNGIVVTSSSPSQHISNNIIGGNNVEDSCSVYYGPVSGGELPAGTAGGARMLGIVFSAGTNTVSNNLIKNFFSYSNAANTGNSSANILGILATSGNNGQMVSNNQIDSFILRTGAVGNSISGIVSVSGSVNITNNVISDFYSASTSTSTSTGAAITGINTSAAQVQTITDNTIFGFDNTSATSNQMSGIVVSAGAGNMIRNNTIRNLRSNTTSATGIIGINNPNTSMNTSIIGNTIHSLVSYNSSSSGPGVFGITNSGSTTIVGNNALVTRNVIHSFGVDAAGTGIAILTGIQATSGNALYANNMIRLGRDTTGTMIGRTTTIRGMQLSPTGAVQNRFYHNSIYVEAAPAIGTANTVGIDLTGNITAPGFMDIRNNIVVNNTLNAGATGNHYVIRHNSTSFANYTINSNIYSNIPGATYFVGRFNTVDYATLTAWKTGVLTDGATGFTNPGFVNATGDYTTVNLHLALSNPAERGGDPSVGAFVTDDADGALRDTLNKTDIGADAMNGTISSDVNAPVINYTPLAITTSISDRIVSATITDGGGLPQDPANQPRIYFKKSAGGTWMNATGTLASGDRFNGNWTFTINNTTLGGVIPGDSIFYYIIAQDSLANNVNTNSMYATATGVGSVTIHPVTPNSYRINSPFPTTVLVGTGQTYLTLTGTGGAFEAINSGILGANVEVLISSSITEPGTVALNKWQEQGAGGYVVTIRPQLNAQVVLSSTVGNASGLIRLNNTSGVKMLGWSPTGTIADTNLIIRASSTTTPALGFVNGGMNDTFQNVIFESRASSTAVGVILVAATVAPATNGVSNVLIQRCHVRQDITNAATPTNGIFIIGTSPRMNSNIRMDGNFIYNILGTGGNGINVSGTGTGNGNNFTITNNHFFVNQVASITVPYQAITFGPGAASDNNIISNNWIGGSAPFATGAALTTNNQIVPISVTSGTITGTTLSSNVINNITLTGTSGITGIFTQGTNAVYTITGNRIGDWSNPLNSINFTATSNNRLQGINAAGTGNVTVSNDTVVNIMNMGVGATVGITGILVGGGTSNVTNISNNVVNNLVLTASANTGTQTTAALLGIICTSGSTNQTISNNTVRSLVSTAVAGHQLIGILNTSGITTISNNLVYGIQSSTTATGTTASAGIIGICNNSSSTGIHTSNNNIVDSMWYTSGTPAGVQMIGIGHTVNTSIHQSMIFDNVVKNMNSRSTLTSAGISAAIIGIFQGNPALNLQVSRNTVSVLNHFNTTAVSIIGIYNNGSATLNGNSSFVSRNFVHSFRSTASTPAKPVFTGIFNNAGFTTYSNNMIRLGIDSGGVVDTSARIKRGIFQNNNAQNRYYHNTIFIAGAPLSSIGMTNSAAIELGLTIPNIVGFNVKVDIRNNILVNQSSSTLPDTSRHFALRFIDTINITSNYNLFHLTGTNGFIAGINANNYVYTQLGGAVGSWNERAGQDLQSGFGDPMLNPNVLGTADVVSMSVQGTTPIEHSGDPAIASIVTDDFFGSVRSSNTPTDIGAHAGNFNQAPDLFAPVINYTPLIASGTLSGVRPFTGVTITDNNGIPTSGVNRPRVYFTKDGSTWFSTASTSITGTASNAVANFSIDYSLLGTLTAVDTIRYYVLVQDNAGNVLSNAPYAIASNVNTVSIHPLNANKYNFLPVLAANTIIPVGIGQSYTSLTSVGGAFEFINSRTLGGSIFLDITSDLNNESGAISLNQFGEDGAGAGTYTITIRPVSGTVTERLISGNVGGSMITLSGASRVKITGVPSGGSASVRLLHFRNSNATASTIMIRNGAQGVRLHNLILEGGNTSTNNGVLTFAVTAGTIPCSNDTVSGCLIKNDPTASLPNGVPNFGIYSDGAVGVLNAGMVFSNNEIANYLNSGIAIANNNGNGFTVTGNSFYNTLPTLPSATQFVAINAFVGPNSSGNNFSNNFIGGSAPNCGGAPWTSTSLTTVFQGIRAAVGNGANTLIQNNTIRNIAFTNAGTAAFNGIINDQGNSIISGNSIGSTTVNNSIVFANASTHTGINYTGPNASSITGNTIAGITVGTAGQTASFNGITVTNGAVGNIDNNTIGGPLANSIVNLGTGITNGLNLSVPLNFIAAYSASNNTVQNINMPGAQASTIIRGILVAGSALPVVENNTVTNLTSNGTTIASTGTGHLIAGITIAAATNVVPKVRFNTISALRALNATASATPNVSGIALSSGQGALIDANRIFDLSNASTSSSLLPTPSVSAINIGGGSVSAFVTNNQITLGTGQTANTQFIGIWLNFNTTAFVLNAAHNSVLINGTLSSGNQNSYAFLRGNNTTTEMATFLNLRNNIFANNRSGGSGSHFAIANQTPSPTNTTWVPGASQYNLLVTANPATMGQWGTSPNNYASWINGSVSTSDAMSYYMQAGASAGQLNLSNLFTSTTNGNLGIQSGNIESWYIFGKGAAGSVVNNLNTDYNGVTRGTTYGFGNTIGSIQLNTVPAMLPPAAVASSAPAANTTVNYTFAGRQVAAINWGASVPVTATLLNYTGITPANQPSGNNANQYLRVDVSGGTTPYSYGIDMAYDPAILGAITAVSNLKVSKETTGSTAVNPVWATQPVSTVNTSTMVVSAAGLTSTATNLFFALTQNDAPPVINSFTPNTRQVGGAVTIYGRNFTGTSALVFANGVAQPTFAIVNDTTITTTVPTGAVSGVVSATNGNGTGVSTAVMNVIQPPTITSFNPATTTRGATVILTGTNFGTVTQVQFNAITAVFTVNSATQITATVPATATTGNITVTNPAGTAGSASPFTVILAPTVTLLAPATGPVGTSVTITGTNFLAITNVTFNGVAASYTVNSGTQITATVPAGATTGLVGVTNGSGTGNSAANFTVTTPPTITAFNPSSGGVGTVVTITGTNFTGATAVTFNGVAASSFVVNSATQITATVAATSTTGVIVVTTPSGSENSGVNFVVIGDLIVSTIIPVTGTYNNITVTSTGYATLSGPLTALGNVLVQSGGKVDFGTNILNGNGSFTNQNSTQLITADPAGFTTTGGVSGSIQVAGTRTYAAAAHYNYNGAVAQNTGDGILAADTITVANTAGVMLSANTTINSRLILGVGNLTLGNFSLTTAPSASILAASATSYIVTSSSPTSGGFLRRTVANTATSVVYPIGTVTSYTPAALQQTVAGTTDVFAVRAFNGVNTLNTSGAPIGTNAVGRTWLITETVSGGSNLSLSLTWNATDELSGFLNTSCNIAHNFGSVWNATTNAAATGSNPFTRVRTGITFAMNNTGFAVGDNSGVLPVTLVQFKANALNEDVLLNWTTASETNNEAFIVERSADGVVFEEIDRIKGAGNSNKLLSYKYTDQQAFAKTGVSTLYYRIKDLSNSGVISEASEIVSVSMGEDMMANLSIYPNPFEHTLHISLVSADDAKATVTITDIQGKKWYTAVSDLNKGINNLELTEVNNLQAGVYFVQVTMDGETKTYKVMKH